MEKSVFIDIETVIKDKELRNLGASFYLFGSFINKNIEKEKINDIDIAIEIPPETKFDAVLQLFKLARKVDRKLNWNIDVYNPNLITYGYNGRLSSPLHFFIIDKDELASNSIFSDSIKKNFIPLTPTELNLIKHG